MSGLVMSSIAFLLMFSLVQLGTQFSGTMKAMYMKASILWAKVIALSSYLMVLVVLLGSSMEVFEKSVLNFNVNQIFDRYEILGIFVAMAIMLLPHTRIAAILSVIYLSIKMNYFNTVHTGGMLILISFVLLSVFFDELPWIAPNDLQKKKMINQSLIILSAAFGVMVIFYSLLNIESFAVWSKDFAGISVIPEVWTLLLVSLIFLWISLAIGISPRVLLPLVLLPFCLSLMFLFKNVVLSILFLSFLVSLWIQNVKSHASSLLEAGGKLD